MLAANQRPILALGTLVVLLGLVGCAPAVRPRVATLPAPTGQASATHVTPAEREFPANPGPSAGPGAPAATAESEEFQSSHPKVQDFVDRYQTSMRPYMQRALQRGSKYLPRNARILVEEGVPAQLAYLPIVESGFSLHAVSHAGAVGPWQFVRGTGQRYGLRIDGYVDERRDPEMATRAAARYLRDLYERFGDWHLALAGYNSGEGNIERIQAWKGCENYWEMSDRGYLPVETSEFVPRFLAAVEVAMSPAYYGFDIPTTKPTRFDTIEVTRPDLAQGGGPPERQRRGDHPRAQPGAQPRRGASTRLRGAPPQGHARAVRAGTGVVPRARTGRPVARRPVAQGTPRRDAGQHRPALRRVGEVVDAGQSVAQRRRAQSRPEPAHPRQAESPNGVVASETLARDRASQPTASAATVRAWRALNGAARASTDGRGGGGA